MRPALSLKRTDQKGFTLIELIVAMAIFGIIGSVLVTIFVAGITYYSQEKSQLLNQENISGISAAFEADTRKSSAATISGSCLVFTLSSGTTSTYCLNTSTHQYSRNNSVIADNITAVSYTITLNKRTAEVHSLFYTLADSNPSTTV